MPAKLKLYVGSRDYRPEGYLTVDADAAYTPDVVADIRNLHQFADDSCAEIIAGHVLEHVEWPDSFKALSEFARVLEKGGLLKISVPDMGLLLRMILGGDSAFHAMSLIYGARGRTNQLEKHRYGFTAGMLVDILEVLGFGKFNWWNSELSDASNGWCPRALDKHVGISLNVAAVKAKAPVTAPMLIYRELVVHSMDDFMDVVARVVSPKPAVQHENVVAKLYQNIHFQLIDARHRIKYLEELLSERDNNSCDNAAAGQHLGEDRQASRGQSGTEAGAKAKATAERAGREQSARRTSGR